MSPFLGSAISAILEVSGTHSVLDFCPSMMEGTISWEACALVLVLALLMASHVTTGKSLKLVIGKCYVMALKSVSRSTVCEQKLFTTSQTDLKRRKLKTQILLPILSSLRVGIPDLLLPTIWDQTATL